MSETELLSKRYKRMSGSSPPFSVDDFWSKKAAPLDERNTGVCARNGSKGNADYKAALGYKEQLSLDSTFHPSTHLFYRGYAIKPRAGDGRLLVAANCRDHPRVGEFTADLAQTAILKRCFGDQATPQAKTHILILLMLPFRTKM
jgi:hypothetical protein